jgi:hypothetical protein
MHFSTNQLLLKGGFEDLVSKEAAREGNLTCSKVRHALLSGGGGFFLILL